MSFEILTIELDQTTDNDYTVSWGITSKVSVKLQIFAIKLGPRELIATVQII